MMLSAVKTILNKYQKQLPVLFFMGGFIWDSLTLGRIDGWYSNFILLTYLSCLTISIYIYNLEEDGAWENTVIDPWHQYAIYAIQFFLGGLTSAYVIFFFQSVSLTKTLVFFVILVILLISNEMLKHQISNKYLQFGAYYFINFTFFIFFIPILVGAMNAFWFFISGIISLVMTFYFIQHIYRKSPSTRKQINKPKLVSIVIGIYLFINLCYYFNLIPPVPISLQEGMVAYDVQKKDNSFHVTFEQAPFYAFWKSYDHTFRYQPGDTVFVYTSIFAPAELNKNVQHHWQWYHANTDRWNSTDRISYQVIGGRKGGFRGYTFKENIWPGLWKVDVITDEGLVLGELKFQINTVSTNLPPRLTTRTF